MRAALFLLITVCYGQALAQSPVANWFPLQVGNRWTYQHEFRQGDPQHPAITRWNTIETVVGMREIAQGTVVLRNVEPDGGADQSWLAGFGESHYLIRNSCLYFLDPAYSWDADAGRLRDEFREKLVSGDAEPELCFPLVTGKTFGKDLPPGWNPWRVAGQGAGSDFAPASVTSKAFDVVGHLVLANTTHIWFEKGVGIVGQRDWHDGTYLEYRGRLLKFVPARQ